MSEEENTQGTDTGSQIDVARELNSVLEQVSNRLERIQQLTQSQADFMNQMALNFQNMTDFMSSMSERSEEIRGSLEDAVDNVQNNFNQEKMQNLNDELEKVSDNCVTMTEAHTESLKNTSKRIKNISDQTQETNRSLEQATNVTNKSLTNATAAINNFGGGVAGVSKETSLFASALQYLKDKIQSLMSAYGQMIKNALSAGLSIAKSVFSLVSSFVGTAAKFVKFAATLPFTITKYAANIGYKIRRELVEVIQSATEALKEKFDMDSSIGRGIEAMTKRGKGMLLAFQNPSAELVKLFGFGAEGIANMIGFMGENIDAMGHFSEVFGESLMNNGPRLKNFARMVKGFGFGAEDVAYMAQDAGVNMKHIEVRMAELGVTLESTAKEFGVDRKRLSKNFMIMRKDIVQFGHLSDEEIARTTSRLTQMRVKLEDAAAVFKKFSTFEDAANSVAMLSQAFGMNLDAMDIIQAKNPEDIIDMFRNSMLETGRSFSDLNRFEKELMAQHTGMTSESINALMNYRNLGLTHEEAVRRMESKKPEAKQMAALKKLNSAIKEVQKVLQFDSPFKAFFEGLSKNTALSGDLKNAVLSLSQGYEGIYNFALKLNPKTWEGLIDPIVMIVNAMRSIFQSEEFRKGLVGALSTTAKFVGSLFGITKGDTILTRVIRNVKIGFGKGGKYEGDQTEIKKFKGLVFKGVETKSGILDSYLTQDKLKTLKKIKDPAELLNELQKIKSGISGRKTDVHKAFDEMFKQIAMQIQKEYDKKSAQATTTATANQKSKVHLVKRDSVNILTDGFTEVLKENKGNAGKLFSMSGRIAGAILKGGVIGFTAFLRVLNDQFRAYKEGKDANPDAKKNNMIEDFLGFEPGEFSRLGKSISEAFFTFVENADSTVSIFGWMINGIKDVFMLVGGFFYETLKTAISKLLGIAQKEETTQELMKKNTNKLTRTKTSTTQANITKSIANDDYVENVDSANMIRDFSDIISNNNKIQEKDRKRLQNVTTSLTQRMEKGIMFTEDKSKVAKNLDQLYRVINSGNEASIDHAIKDALPKLEKYLEEKKKDDLLQIALYKAQNQIKHGGKISNEEALKKYYASYNEDSMSESLRTGTANSVVSNTLGVVGTGLGLYAGGKAGALLGAKLGLIGGPFGSVAGALIGGLIGAGLGFGAAYYLGNKTATGLGNVGRIYNDRSNVDLEGFSVEDYAGSGSISGLKTLDYSLMTNLFTGVEDVDTKTYNDLEGTSETTAVAKSDDLFNEVSKLAKINQQKITREEYNSFIDMFNKFKEDFTNNSKLELDADFLFDGDTVRGLIKSLVPAGLYSYFFDPSLSQGVLQPTESGQCRHPALQDGALNTPATIEYDSRYS